MIELSEQCNGYCRPGCNLAHLRHVWRDAGEEHGHLDTYSRICCIKGGHALRDCVPNYRHGLFFCWHTSEICGAVRQAKLDCSQCKPGHVLATVLVDRKIA